MISARRLVASAHGHGIDLSLIFGTLDTTEGRTRVRQACLTVIGSGRTAMVFVSEPPRAGDPDGMEVGIRERAACVNAACEFLSKERSAEVKIAQALPDPKEWWGLRAFEGAGFRKVGELVYLRRPLEKPQPLPQSHTWPQGIEVITSDQLHKRGRDEIERMFVSALDRSYEETLDCPELCGLRETRDVLQSHRSTGVYDPALWWVVLLDGIPEGCMLLNRCPEQRTVELVYLGLGKRLRGKGLARAILSMGIHKASIGAVGWSMSCAVDRRNAPALRLYHGMGFRAAGERVALVRLVMNE